MATATALAPTKQQTKMGRVYYDKFITWCDKTKKTPSSDLLIQWDEDVNLSRIRALFGEDEDIYRAGLQALYTRFFYNYSALRIESPSGKTVSILPYRKAGAGIGNSADLSSPHLNIGQLEYMREKAKITARNAAERLRVLNLKKPEVVSLFNEAIDEAYA